MKLRINLFGNFEIIYGDKSIDDIDTPRQQEFLTFLLLNRDRAITRRRLSYLIWLNSNEKQAKANLRNLLHTVRKNLPDADQFIKVDHNSIKWNNVKGVELDVEEFEKSIENARIAKEDKNFDEQEDELKNGIALYKGKLVPNCYSEWIEDYRNNYKQFYLEALKALISLLETKRKYKEAIHFGNKLVKTEPYDEKAWRLLIKLYSLNNDRVKAIRCYKDCIKTLRDELNIEPTAETKILYEQILKNYQSVSDGNSGQTQELMNKEKKEVLGLNREDDELKTKSEILDKEKSSKSSGALNADSLLPGLNVQFRDVHNNPFTRLRGLNNKKILFSALLLTSIIIFLVIWIVKVQPDYTSIVKDSRETIAILPFKDLSDEKNDGRFTQGMTDILNNNLAKVQNFRVISYNTVDYYSKNYEQARLISDLNLDYLIEGSVQIVQDKVRINIQVLNAKTNEYIWSNSYIRLLGDVLILQSQIAEDIVGRIESAFQMGNKLNLPNPGKIDPVAFELYLKGIEEQNKKDFLGFRQSANLFRQSISIDSSFTLAYSNLAFTYIMLELLNTEANYKKEITTAINKALELNPNSSMAYVVRGLNQHLLDYQWALADESFKMSIELNASSDIAHHEYAHFLMRWGKFEEAFHHERIALSLNPISPDLQSGLGQIFLFNRDYESAIKELKKALDINPTYSSVNFWLTRAYIHNQEYEKAIETNNNFSSQGGYNFKSEILAYMGQKGEALDLLRELKNDFVRSPYKTFLAQIIYVTYIALEEKQEALYWFEQAFEHETGWMSYIKVNPALDYIREEPRFKEIERKIFSDRQDS